MRSRFSLLAFLVLPLAFLAQAEEQDSAPDELPIRKVLLSVDRLAVELERVKQGAFVRMPLTEFDERVRAYRTRQLGKPSPPRLVEATYKARLFDDPSRRGEAWLGGTASLTALRRDKEPAVLPLAPLSLAIQKARFENREALVGEFEGEQPGLLLDREGRQTALLDWTARGEHTPEGVVFDWRVPPSPQAILELNLPVGRALSVTPEGPLVVGPEAADTPERRTWKVYFSHRSTFFLTVSPPVQDVPGLESAGPFVLDHVLGRHHLTPEGVEVEFMFDLRVGSRGLRSLTFACDAPLQPYRAALQPGDSARLDRMEWRPAGPGQRSLVTLHFHDPLSGTVHPRLFCRAALSVADAQGLAPWNCPGVTLQPGNLVPRVETIELKYHPQYRLEQWQPGDFRVNAVETAPDGTRKVVLGSMGLPSAVVSRPRALVRGQEVVYHARVHSWWRIGPVNSTLDVQVQLDVRHGKLFELPIWFSPGWEVEQVSCTDPAERLTHWSVNQTPSATPRFKGGSLLTLHLEPPFVKADGEKASVTLRLSRRGPATGLLPLPSILPTEAATLDGTLAMDWNEENHDGSLTVVPPGTSMMPTRPIPMPDVGLVSGDGPWGGHLPTRRVAWIGHPYQGTLLLRPRRLLLQAHSRNDVRLDASPPTVSSRLTVEATSGSLETFEVRFSSTRPPDAAAPRFEILHRQQGCTVQVRSVERAIEGEVASAFGLLGGANPLGCSSLLSQLKGGEHWRVTLTQPLKPGQPLILGVEEKLKKDESGVSSVPLLLWGDNRPHIGEVRVFASADLPPEAIRGVGLRGLSISREETSLLRRSYRPEGDNIALQLIGPVFNPAESPTAETTARLPRAELLTRVDPEGCRLFLYTFEVRDWARPTLPLRLPPHTRVVSLRVNERDATDRLTSSGTTESGLTVELPVPREQRGAGVRETNRYEVLYLAEGSPAWLCERIESPVPVAPLEPQVFRRVWRLPAGVTPLSQVGLLRLPGPPVSSGLASWSLVERLPSWASRVPHVLAFDRWALHQEQAVRAADDRFRRTFGGQTVDLGEALRQFASGGLTEQGFVLLIDGLALAEAGLHPGYFFPVEPVREEDGPALASLATLDLLYVPCKAGPLITTRRQWLAWDRAGSGNDKGAAPRPVLDALAVAVAKGQDDTGRFQSISSWLERPPPPHNDETSSPGPALGRLTPEDELAAWTDWLATAEASDVLWVVRARGPSGAGMMFAVLFLLWALRARRLRRKRMDEAPFVGMGRQNRLVLILWLALMVTGSLWLPEGLRDLGWWPLAVGVLVSLWWYLVPLSRRDPRDGLRHSPSSTHRSLPAAVPAAGVAVLFWATWSVGPAAQPVERPALPPDTTVYLLPGKAEGDPVDVLVQPTLLQRLDRKPASKSLAEAVLVAAEYQAVLQPGGRVVRVDADLHVHCLSAKPSYLVLPAVGWAIDRDPLLDGVKAGLTALPSPQSGDALKINGVGPHRVQLSFLATVNRTRDLYEIAFSVPRVAKSKLSLRLPGKRLFLQSLGNLGAQKITEDATGTLLEVDVGPVVSLKRDTGPSTSPLQVRWMDGKPGKAVPQRYREAYLWDLGQKGHSLTGVVIYELGTGMVDRLTLNMPPELVVHRLDVRRPDLETGGKPDADTSSVRLRDWRLETIKGSPQLQVEFQSPVGGRIQILMTCYPRADLVDPARTGPGKEALLTLPVPSPQGTPIRNGGYLAYRLQGLGATRGQILRISGLDAADFPTFYWMAAEGRKLPQIPPVYACRIERVGKDGPILPLSLRATPARHMGSMNIIWRVGSLHATMKATLEVETKDGQLSLLECDVPASLEVSSVKGAQVHEWASRNVPGVGQRLQIWLTRSASLARVELQGQMTLTRPQLPEPRWLPLGPALGSAVRSTFSQASPFTLPVLRLHGLENSAPTSTIELIAAQGLSLSPQALRGFTPETVMGPRERLSLTSHRDDYGGRFLITPSRLPSVRVTTMIEKAERQLSFRVRIDPLTADDRLRSLFLELKGWTAAGVRAEAADAKVVADTEGTERTWEVTWEKSDGKGILLTGKTTLEDDALPTGFEEDPRNLPFPSLRLKGVVCAERWVLLDAAASSFRIAASGARNVAVSEAPQGKETANLIKSGGKVWQLAPDSERVSLVEPRVILSPVRVASRDHVAALHDARRWSYHSAWWLYHEGPATAIVHLPKDASLVGVKIDGIEKRASADSTGNVTLPLTGRGARRLSIRWLGVHGSAAPPILSPELPSIKGDTGGASVRLLVVSPGHRPGAEGGYEEGVLSTARAELERAAGQLRLQQFFLDSPSPKNALQENTQLAACQSRLARHLWNAGQLLQEEAASGTKGREYRELNERLEFLRSQQKGPPHLEESNEDFSDDDLEDLTRVGRLWVRVDSGVASSALPMPELLDDKGSLFRRKLALTGLLLLVLFGAWVLSSFKSLATATHVFWPEQAIVLGLVGLRMFGPSWLVLFLLLLGGSARLLTMGSFIVSMVQRWLRPSEPQPT